MLASVRGKDRVRERDSDPERLGEGHEGSRNVLKTFVPTPKSSLWAALPPKYLSHLPVPLLLQGPQGLGKHEDFSKSSHFWRFSRLPSLTSPPSTSQAGRVDMVDVPCTAGPLESQDRSPDVLAPGPWRTGPSLSSQERVRGWQEMGPEHLQNLKKTVEGGNMAVSRWS